MNFIGLIIFFSSMLAIAADDPAPLKETLSTYSQTLSSPTPVASCAESNSVFCNDPYAAICADMTTHRDSQLSRLDGIAKKLPEGQMHVSEKGKNLKESFDTVLKYMRESIAASGMTDVEKSSFDALLLRTTIRTSSDIRKELAAKKTHTAKERLILDTAETVCDYNNTSPKAVCFDADGEQRTNDPLVVVCDGIFDSLPENGSNLTDRLFMVMAHEMSHSFSAHWYRGTYQKFSQCLAGEKGESVVKEYTTAFPDEGMGDPVPTGDQVIGAMMEEAGCDHWAKDAFGRYLRSTSSTPQDNLQKLRQSYGYFCGAKYSGTHPSGKFRIEMIGKDPEVRKLMGCTVPGKPDPKASACKL